MESKIIKGQDLYNQFNDFFVNAEKLRVLTLKSDLQDEELDLFLEGMVLLSSNLVKETKVLSENLKKYYQSKK